jgi:hypothetical protein
VSRVFAPPAVRVWLAVVVVVVFAVVGAVLVFASQGPPPQPRTFHLQVTGTKMTPDQVQANQGDTLTISIEADQAEEIHLHGYDKHFFPAPGQPASLTFASDRTGSFVLEIEASSTPLGTLVVQPRAGLFGIGRPADQSSTTVVKSQYTNISKIATTASYNLGLQVGPLQPMYTPAEVAQQHPKVGEVMFSGQMSMPPAGASPDWRHLEVHVIDRRSGDPVQGLSPVITVTSRATAQSRNLPITTMQGLTDGPKDFHYGNNVELPKGRYTVTVQIGPEVGTFDITFDG